MQFHELTWRQCSAVAIAMVLALVCVNVTAEAAPTSRPATKPATKASSRPAPTKAAPTKAAPTKAAPSKAAPTKAAPTKAAPTKAAPTKAAAKAAPRKAAPASASPRPVAARKAAPKARAAAPAPVTRAAPRTAARTAPRPAAGPAKKRAYTGRMRRGIKFIGNQLRTFLMEHGRDPNNPWLLAHSLLALGKDLKLKNGQLAIDRIVSGYLKFHKKGKRSVGYFPPGTNKDRVEPHPYMHLKTFLEIGVPLTHKFKVGKRSITLKELLDDAIYTFPAAPKGKAFGPLAWRMILLYGRTPKKQWTWNNHKGHTVNYFRILFKAFKYANKQSNFLRVLKANGVKVIQKRKQYIYQEACGGFHLLQSTMRWMGHPHLLRHTKSALKTHKELIFYRMKGEVALYLSLFKKYQKNVAYRFVIMLQQLKFLGHALETIGNLHKWGLLTPTLEERKQIREALRLMLVTVMLLQRLGFYKGIQRLKKSTYQFYLDLLGDSAHALNALNLLKDTNIYRP